MMTMALANMQIGRFAANLNNAGYRNGRTT